MEKNYVYVLSCNDAVKVGRSTNVKGRLSGHRTSNPWIKFVTDYEAPVSCEAYVHMKLEPYRKEGCTEWFNYYEGIYEDIAKYVQEGIDIEKEKERLAKNAEYDRLYSLAKNSEFKVWKFKDSFRNDYAFVVAESKPTAISLLKMTTFVRFDFIEKRDLVVLDKIILNERYIHQSTIRTVDEYQWCKTNNVNYNTEYGISKPRQKSLMVPNEFIPKYYTYRDKYGNKRRRKKVY